MLVLKFDVEYFGEPAGWLEWTEETGEWTGEIDGPTTIGAFDEPADDWVQLVSEVAGDAIDKGYTAGQWEGFTWGLARP